MVRWIINLTAVIMAIGSECRIRYVMIGGAYCCANSSTMDVRDNITLICCLLVNSNKRAIISHNAQKILVTNLIFSVMTHII